MGPIIKSHLIRCSCIVEYHTSVIVHAAAWFASQTHLFNLITSSGSWVKHVLIHDPMTPIQYQSNPKQSTEIRNWFRIQNKLSQNIFDLSSQLKSIDHFISLFQTQQYILSSFSSFTNTLPYMLNQKVLIKCKHVTCIQNLLYNETSKNRELGIMTWRLEGECFCRNIVYKKRRYNWRKKDRRMKKNLRPQNGINISTCHNLFMVAIQ